VNLAIGALGPPPTLPGPVTGNPPPVTTPGGGGPPPVTGQCKPGYHFVAAAGAGKTLVKGAYLVTGGTCVPDAGPVKQPVPPGRPPTGGGGGKKPTASVPTGLTVTEKHSTSLQVRWNKSKNATGYHVKCTDMATKKATNEFDVAAAQTDANCSGLTPGHSYVIDVWAEPEAGNPGSGAHAEISTTLPKTG
jgi:hypothetical protein